MKDEVGVRMLLLAVDVDGFEVGVKAHGLFTAAAYVDERRG